jgi:hypothetical protein
MRPAKARRRGRQRRAGKARSDDAGIGKPLIGKGKLAPNAMSKTPNGSIRPPQLLRRKPEKALAGHGTGMEL